MTFGVLAKWPFFTGRDNPITFLHFSKQEPHFRLCINMSTVTRLKQPVDVNCSVQNGQLSWHGWQNTRFQYQRSAVRIPPLANCFKYIYYW